MVQLALIIYFPHALTVHCACVVVDVGLTTSCEVSDVIAVFWHYSVKCPLPCTGCLCIVQVWARLDFRYWRDFSNLVKLRSKPP